MLAKIGELARGLSGTAGNGASAAAGEAHLAFAIRTSLAFRVVEHSQGFQRIVAMAERELRVGQVDRLANVGRSIFRQSGAGAEARHRFFIAAKRGITAS